jgi:hypothetical protein
MFFYWFRFEHLETLYSTFEKYFEFIANKKEQTDRILLQQKKPNFISFKNQSGMSSLIFSIQEGLAQKTGSKAFTPSTTTVTTNSRDVLLMHEKTLNESDELSDKKRKRKKSQIEDDDDDYLDETEENESGSEQYKSNSHLTTKTSSSILFTSSTSLSSSTSSSLTFSTISTVIPSKPSSVETKQSKKRRIGTEEMDMYLSFFSFFHLLLNNSFVFIQVLIRFGFLVFQYSEG